MSLVAGLFGMNTVNNPIEGNPLDFWIVVGIIFAFGTLTYIFFRLRNWF
jgi:Mg2+ and Co2+ transporter CorA